MGDQPECPGSGVSGEGPIIRCRHWNGAMNGLARLRPPPETLPLSHPGPRLQRHAPATRRAPSTATRPRGSRPRSGRSRRRSPGPTRSPGSSSTRRRRGSPRTFAGGTGSLTPSSPCRAAARSSTSVISTRPYPAPRRRASRTRRRSLRLARTLLGWNLRSPSGGKGWSASGGPGSLKPGRTLRSASVDSSITPASRSFIEGLRRIGRHRTRNPIVEAGIRRRKEALRIVKHGTMSGSSPPESNLAPSDS